jgi:hypothetical protein
MMTHVRWLRELTSRDTGLKESIQINSRFHGPACSGNGGYSCGLMGQHIDGPTAVRLRIPPPLDTDMDLRRKDQDLELFHGDVMVASARPAEVDIAAPSSPGYAQAVLASQRYRGFDSHFYPGCFVCGPEREAGDGLRIFAGPVTSADGPDGMVAAAWVPDDSLIDSTGFVATPFLWAALDCPGAYSFPEPEKGTILLGELAVSIEAKVRAGEKCVLIGWEISHKGRKHHTGTALYGESGTRRAIAYATWFEVPVAPA